MKLTIEMPWEKDLSVNAYRFGRPLPGRKFQVRKPHVQAWMGRLAQETWLAFSALETRKFVLPLLIGVAFRFPDRRHRDSHNYSKVLCDSVAVALGVNDANIWIECKGIMVDPKNPGFTIEITDGEECGD